MDQGKIGMFLRELRSQKNMTQRQLADQLGISDKTVSKWECGQGCPDLSILPRLAAILGISMEDLLSGQLPSPIQQGGNMKNTHFYICPQCGNILTASGAPTMSCCGRLLDVLNWQKADEAHDLHIDEIDGEWFLSSPHPMTKQHSLTFAALVTAERLTLVRQWPEWDFQVRLPKRGHGILYWYCNQHGLFRKLL